MDTDHWTQSDARDERLRLAGAEFLRVYAKELVGHAHVEQAVGAFDLACRAPWVVPFAADPLKSADALDDDLPLIAARILSFPEWRLNDRVLARCLLGLVLHCSAKEGLNAFDPREMKRPGQQKTRRLLALAGLPLFTAFGLAAAFEDRAAAAAGWLIPAGLFLVEVFGRDEQAERVASAKKAWLGWQALLTPVGLGASGDGLLSHLRQMRAEGIAVPAVVEDMAVAWSKSLAAKTAENQT